MNPYLEDGPCARLSFDPAYCKRCTGPPSVNDGYITGPGYGRPVGRAPQRPFPPVRPAPAGTAATLPEPAPGPAAPVRQRAAARVAHPACASIALPDTIATIETLVRQRSNGAFIMRV
ncbi:hypothetical protein BCO37747_07612 [Burkholderia contaminans]|uniref:Uncharacterized protein n=1 Tax=Burkholderia contaminans TaxID=488447 RepID=A0A250LA38_9BURK|nr:hypothetical protein SK875_A00201 [Burkholderia contaminans]VWB32449.1 hypothetical protein BCO23253_01404 [Burkholderia contaminans]VWC88372.1 hypothetical protein BCO18175_03205 [Burkholderia contaminans]VWD63051.1 hypothetical protein BCO37747_07612 [Burkholderia contaminans]BBA41403.1 hypothetical protein BCCH1_38560 [Burkholderia contaminans]